MGQFEFEISPDENLIRMHCVGEFTIEELIAHTVRVNEHPDFRPGMDTLGDYREAQWIGDPGAITEYVEHTASLEKIRGNCKWAVLTRDESDQRLIGLFDLVNKRRGIQIETRAFDTEKAAHEWLGH